MEKVGLAALRDDKEAFQILPVAVDEGRGGPSLSRFDMSHSFTGVYSSVQCGIWISLTILQRCSVV